MSNTLDNNQHSPAASPDADEPEPSGPRIEISVDDSVRLPLTRSRLCQAAQAAAAARGFSTGEIGIRVTDDRSIRELNARHLNHDYETDVISFSYGCSGNEICGELVVSAQTARARASELGWNPGDELLLYVVHGVLHIAGMDDRQGDDRARIRQAEQEVMLGLGVQQILRFAADLGTGQEADDSETSA